MVARTQHQLYDRRSSDLDDTSSCTSSTLASKEGQETPVNNVNTNSQRQQQRRKKNVRFDLDSNAEHRNTQFYKEDIVYLDLWYTPGILRMLKSSTNSTARTYIKLDSESTAPFSYRRVMGSVFSACCDSQQEIEFTNDSEISAKEHFLNHLLTSNEQARLSQWMERSISRVGLERMVVREMVKDRADRKKEIVHLVKQLQAIHNDFAERDEIIRKNCQRISRPHRLFATMLATVQAAVSATCDDY